MTGISRDNIHHETHKRLRVLRAIAFNLFASPPRRPIKTTGQPPQSSPLQEERARREAERLRQTTLWNKTLDSLDRCFRELETLMSHETYGTADTRQQYANPLQLFNLKDC